MYVKNSGHPNSEFLYAVKPLAPPDEEDEGSDLGFEISSVYATSDAGLGNAEAAFSGDDRSSSSSSLSSESSGGLSDNEPAEKPAPKKSQIFKTGKISVESSVRQALNAEKAPLLAFFKRCSKEEHVADLARDSERMQEDWEAQAARMKAREERRLLLRRQKANGRQRKHRAKKKEQEIAQGRRSPGGSRRKLVKLELVDAGKKTLNIAEATRPARALKRLIKDKTRKPQGAKRKRQPRPAKNHNWFTPITWALIEQAAKEAGWQMSPQRIVNIAKARHATIFEGLSRETVRDWIDRSGPKPKWSDATLRRIEAGNVPGHASGGTRGALVSNGL
jgi:hypothetical protein